MCPETEQGGEKKRESGYYAKIPAAGKRERHIVKSIPSGKIILKLKSYASMDLHHVPKRKLKSRW